MKPKNLQMEVQKLQEKRKSHWQQGEVLLVRGEEDISLITERGKKLIEEDLEHGIGGFCHGRFKANLEVRLSKDLEVKDMEVGDQIRGIDVILTVQQVGKKCHDHCPIYTKKGCSFLGEILFLEVEKPGRIRLNEILIYN